MKYRRWKIENSVKAFANLYYKKSILPWLLLPLSWIYGIVIKIRRYLYQKHILKSYRMPVPVIIVGNITLGGTGKTPLTIALVELLKAHGFKPGVISRGYGSQSKRFPFLVSEKSSGIEAGDEPLLIHLRTRVPVIIDPNRPRAAEFLLKHFNCDVIISDDGLQHYALQRDIEIAVIDAERQFGNGFLFPAGPLREPKSRLADVDFVVSNGVSENSSFHVMALLPGKIHSVKTHKPIDDIKFFADKNLIAMAGIGNPERFFQTLTELGLIFVKQPMPDHYFYSAKDFEAADDVYYLMTEKDAVKCQAFSRETWFYLPVTAELSWEFKTAFVSMVNTSD